MKRDEVMKSTTTTKNSHKAECVFGSKVCVMTELFDTGRKRKKLRIQNLENFGKKKKESIFLFQS